MIVQSNMEKEVFQSTQNLFSVFGGGLDSYDPNSTWGWNL